MNKKRHQLYLFSQLPIGAVFAYESPTNPQQLKKINETQAIRFHYPGWEATPINIGANVLVFPVYPFSLIPRETE